MVDLYHEAIQDHVLVPRHTLDVKEKVVIEKEHHQAILQNAVPDPIAETVMMIIIEDLNDQRNQKLVLKVDLEVYLEVGQNLEAVTDVAVLDQNRDRDLAQDHIRDHPDRDQIQEEGALINIPDQFQDLELDLNLSQDPNLNLNQDQGLNQMGMRVEKMSHWKEFQKKKRIKVKITKMVRKLPKKISLEMKNINQRKFKIKNNILII